MSINQVTNFLIHDDAELQQRWSSCKAHQWFEKYGWQVGCNFVPSNAINQLEMWQEDSFSPEVIDRELGLAASIGFTTVRVFLHHLVWEQNPQAYFQRIDKFLSLAEKHNIKSMLVLFDAVWNPYPRIGKQPEPRFNVHNSGWVQCPGYDVLNDPERYDDLHSYVHGTVSHFKNDERVLIWDLFNEPDNMNLPCL